MNTLVYFSKAKQCFISFTHTACSRQMSEKIEHPLSSKSYLLGSWKSPLLTVYWTLVRSVIEYGIEIYFFTSTASLDQLFQIQRNALRTCTGASAGSTIR